LPCYKVRERILGVLAAIGPEFWRIYVVDDACPEGSGAYASENCHDPRLEVIRLPRNLGVGGAVMSGFARALEDGADILVKIDGDGQMDPALAPRFIRPLFERRADYAKGNRFYDLSKIRSMPLSRIFGNSALSFLSKLSSGYWNLFDPTNGYLAISSKVARRLPLDKIDKGFFFETDMLFRLNTIRAVVVDVPMDASYGEERSNLSIRRILLPFLLGHAKNTVKRIFYSYFLRDMTAGSLELLAGTSLLLFGLAFGLYNWIGSLAAGRVTPSGTVMLAALPCILGLQFLLAFLNGDINSAPSEPLQNKL
jgi:glycosyltransferase involved in cell wall biosynthesis